MNWLIHLSGDWLTISKKIVSDTGGSLLAAIIAFVAGLLFQWLSDRTFRTLPARALLDFHHPRTARIVLGVPWGIPPNTATLSPTTGMPVFGYGPLMAYREFNKLFLTAYPRIKEPQFSHSKSFPFEDLDHDLILLGFPIGNEITAQVMRDLKIPISFKDHSIVDCATGETLFQATVETGAVVEDFGLLLRAPNPYNPKARVFIIAGCETFGVKAAAEFLDPHNFHLLCGVKWPRGKFLALLHAFLPRTLKSNLYAIVIATHVRSLFTSRPALVQRFSLHGRKAESPSIKDNHGNAEVR